MTKLFIGADHAGFEVKEFLIQNFNQEFDIEDCGSFSLQRTDYTIFSHKLAQGVQNISKSFGILICGSGVGVSIVANRYKNVRAALIYNEEIAKLSRQHNDANIACFGARFFTKDQILNMSKIFLQEEFTFGVHLERLKNIDQNQ